MIDVICGIVGDDDAACARLAKSMSVAMSIDGRSASSFASAPGIAISVVRISPEGPVVAPPTIYQDNGRLVVADLRLDYSCTETAPPGPEKCSGPEYIASLQDEHGADWPAHLSGDFAVATWIAQTQELELVRDRIGVRPIFYAEGPGGTFAFASMPEALHRAGAISGAADLKEIAGLMCATDTASDQTPLIGMRRVLAGHVLTYSRNETKSRRYWRLPVEPVAYRDSDHAAAAETLLTQMRRAVRRRLPPDGPVAAHISGGLDSTSIATLAQHYLGSPPQRIEGWCRRAAKARQRLGAVDQWDLAQETAKAASIPLHECEGDYIRACLEAPLQMAHPDPTGPLDPEFNCLGAAASSGATVLMSGLGGDEGASFDGRSAFVEAMVRTRWLSLWRTASEVARRQGVSPLRLVRGEVLRAFVPDAVVVGIKRLVGRPTTRRPMLDVYLTPARRPATPRPKQDWHSGRLRRALLEGKHYASGLEFRALKAARFGMRYVYPMLDPELLEFTNRLPGLAFIDNGQRRALIRSAMTGLVPEQVLNGPNKMVDDPTESLYLSENSESLARQARILGDVPDVASLIDMNTVAAELQALPSREDLTRRIERAAADGQQMKSLVSAAWMPLYYARFIASAAALRDGESPCFKA